MNKEETENAIKVMQAYVDGKQIEYCIKKDKKWKLCDNPAFNWIYYDYRIAKLPQYRPFQNPLECLQEMQKHQSAGWIACGKDYCAIASIDENGILFMNGVTLCFIDAYRLCTFLDTEEPFGIKI